MAAETLSLADGRLAWAEGRCAATCALAEGAAAVTAACGTEAEMPVFLGEVLAAEALTLVAGVAGTEALTLVETKAVPETPALMGVGDAVGTSTFTEEDDDTETWAEAGSDCRGAGPDTAADTGPGLTGKGDGNAAGEASGRLTVVKGPG